MIEIKNLKKVYKLEDNEVKALDDISLEIKRGEFVIILGQSGCGKSTLLNILGGMDKQTSGQAIVDQNDLRKMKTDQLAYYRRQEVGMIFQKFNLINDMTVLENVMTPMKFSGKSKSAQRKKALEILESIGLKDKIKSVPSKLSGGQQQRVAIARALVNDPKILLCDEPTGNLDSKTGQEILDLLRDLNKSGRTVVVVTHNEAYEKYADKVIKMLDGKIISSKSGGKKSISAEKNEKESTKIKNISYFSKLAIAVKNLKRRKLRFFLTSFGIAIGAMAIVVLVSFGAGLQKDVNNQLASLSQVEEISVSGEKTAEMNFSVGGTNFSKSEKKPLNDSTITELKKISGAEAVYASMNISGEMHYGDKISAIYGEGLTPIKFVKKETKEKVGFGKFIEGDNQNGVVIPYGQATALGFANPADAIGKEVQIDPNRTDKQFKTTIIGVLKEDEKFSYNTYIPYNVAETWFKDINADEAKKTDADLYTSITVRATDTSKVSEVKTAIENLGYGATSYEDIAKQMNRIFTIMQVVLGVIGGIALLVASLGIINTMVMSVLERTKEIGIMKAVGARNRDIRSIFLSEATMIGLFGGLFGLALGLLGSRLAQSIINSYMLKNATSGDSFSFYVPSYLSIGVVLFSILVAGAAGYFPARRGANLNPVEALRDE